MKIKAQNSKDPGAHGVRTHPFKQNQGQTFLGEFQLSFSTFPPFPLFFPPRKSFSTSCRRCSGLLTPAPISPAGRDPLARLSLNYWRVLMDFITTRAPECCSSLVFRRQLQCCSHHPPWAAATSNGLHHDPPHSSGGNIQPRLGCLSPKLLPQGAFFFFFFLEKEARTFYPPVFLPIFTAA